LTAARETGEKKGASRGPKGEASATRPSPPKVGQCERAAQKALQRTKTTKRLPKETQIPTEGKNLNKQIRGRAIVIIRKITTLRSATF